MINSRIDITDTHIVIEIENLHYTGVCNGRNDWLVVVFGYDELQFIQVKNGLDLLKD